MTEFFWYVGGIVFILLGIGFSIGWHELGHLIPAKLFGVKVPKYMIGFGPTLFSRTRGETEYGVKAIPLGGYITMIGMYLPKGKRKDPKGYFSESVKAARSAHSEFVTPEDKNRMFYQLPVFKRIIVMFGGPFMNLFLGVVLTIGTLMGFGTYVRSAEIQEISQCVPSTFAQRVECTQKDAVAPAKAAGLFAGDVVTAVNGKAISNWDEINSYAQKNPGTLNLTVSRGSETLQLQLTPAIVQRPVTQADGTQVNQSGPFFGVVLKPARQPHTFESAMAYSANAVGQTFAMIATLPVQIYNLVNDTITGGERDANGPISLIGIGQVAGEVAANQEFSFVDKFTSGLLMLASLNFALFAFNMIPLLPLDGGHIAGGIYEAIKRGLWRLVRKGDPGPADTALLMPITYVVTILLIALSLVLIVVDLINPVALGN
jgi:membrane-associated protease RseP (regulator of RpoE activity)